MCHLCLCMQVDFRLEAARMRTAMVQIAPSKLPLSIEASSVVEAALRLPPHAERLGPNVQHLPCLRSGTVSDVLAEATGLRQVRGTRRCVLCRRYV